MGKRPAERSAACATCGKTFARSDTLLRHEKNHHATEDRGPVHRVTNGTFRACRLCAQARSRCSGGTPCGRCKTRNLECIYPNKRRKGNQPSFGTMDLTATTPSESLQVPQQYPVQVQQFVFSPAPNSTYTGNSSSGMGQLNTPTEVPGHDRMEMRPQQNDQMRPELNQSLSMPSSSTQHLSQVGANLQDIPGVTQQMQISEQYGDASAALNYQNAFDGQPTGYGGDDMYDESLNLNWIPLSIYPSPYGDMEQDFSFLLPTMSDTGSLSNGFNPLAFEGASATTSGRRHTETVPSASNYQPPASISGLMQSPASNSSDTVAAVGFSFENFDFPEPKKKRRKSSHIPTGFSPPTETGSEFSFPDMSMLSNMTEHMWCSEKKYTLIKATFQQICVNSSRWKPFDGSDLPTLSAFNACIDLYFEYLHPTFPLIHSPTFARNANWLICLATAAIGSTFAAIPNRADAREAFQEFLRRAVLTATDTHDGEFRNVYLAQARVLALVGLAQSDREQLRSRAPRSHADIARWCLESSILQLTASDEEVRSDEDIQAAWDRWVQRESLRRVGYFIWLLDCALGYIGNARPLCNMDDARAPLPCAEALWNASTAQEWLMHRNNTPRMPSLCVALETMYNKKKVEPGLSEISHILLVHALYSRTWEVGTHIKQPMSEWKATGSAKGFLNTPSKDNFWLPLYPLYANWRNSACDCLDVLHWQASAVAARNSGAEHHGILHLHLARVILLTPFQEIQDLIFFSINHRVSNLSKASFYVHDGSYQPRNPAKLPQIRKITWRWLREDQHKARLAIIHAGSVFWHVRRHSKYSFFEPVAIYLASIVLWTYGSYKSAALERYAHNNHSTIARQQQQQFDNDRSHHIQTEPGTDLDVQPTRVERAAQDYAESRSRSSRSKSSQNASVTSGNSPMQPRSFPGAGIPISSQATSHPNHYLATGPSTAHSTSMPVSNAVSENGNEDDEDEGEEDEDEQPLFIHLDRPCDDEIVQHFVRNGHNMSGYMSNVGDVCKTPQKVLLEGAKILRTKLACWGVSREYHDILTRLAEIRKDKDRQ